MKLTLVSAALVAFAPLVSAQTYVAQPNPDTFQVNADGMVVYPDGFVWGDVPPCCTDPFGCDGSSASPTVAPGPPPTTGAMTPPPSGAPVTGSPTGAPVQPVAPPVASEETEAPAPAPGPLVTEPSDDIHNKENCPFMGTWCKAKGTDGNEFAGGNNLQLGMPIFCEAVGHHNAEDIEILITNLTYKDGDSVPNGATLEMITPGWLLTSVYMKAAPGTIHAHMDGEGFLSGSFKTPEDKEISHIDLCIMPEEGSGITLAPQAAKTAEPTPGPSASPTTKPTEYVAPGDTAAPVTASPTSSPTASPSEKPVATTGVVPVFEGDSVTVEKGPGGDKYDMHGKFVGCGEGYGSLCKGGDTEGNEFADPEDLVKDRVISCSVVGTSPADEVFIKVTNVTYNDENEILSVTVEVVGGDYAISAIQMKASDAGENYKSKQGFLGGTFYSPNSKGLSHMDMCVIPKA